MINSADVSIGADPELFLFYEHEQQYIPAIGMIGGTKTNPKPLSREGFAVQEDNVMAEFNIPPCYNPDTFVESIQWAKDQIIEMVPAELQVVAHPSATFDPDYLEHPQAKISGCDPYSNAWKDGAIEESICLEETLDRFCGGHIHLGYPDPDDESRMRLTRGLDLFLAVPGVLLDPDRKRRQTYGKAGAYRDKPYGVEYRSLSNFWVGSEELIRWTYQNVMGAIEFTNHEEPEAMVESVVNKSDKSGAEHLIRKYNIQMPNV